MTSEKKRFSELMARSDELVGSAVLRRAPRVREEEVRQAADSLLLDGERPTVERVRQRLGRGSPNTIALFLDRWWMHLGSRLRDMPGQELPGVPPAVSSALVGLWTSAIDEARSLLKDALAAQATEIEARRQTVEESAFALERSQAEFERERTALERTVAVVQNQLDMANERHEADLVAMGELRAEVAKSYEQREQLQRDVLELASRLETQAREHQETVGLVRERAEASEKHWIKQVDEGRQSLLQERKRAEARERTLAEEISRATSQVSQLNAERQQLQEKLRATTDSLATVRSELSRASEAARLYEAQVTELTRRLDSRHDEFMLARSDFEARLRETLEDALKNTDSTPSKRKATEGIATKRSK